MDVTFLILWQKAEVFFINIISIWQVLEVS